MKKQCGLVLTGASRKPRESHVRAVRQVLSVILVGFACTAAQPVNSPPQSIPEMQRLIAALAGRWSIQQAFEPTAANPQGRFGEGIEVWRPGPGGRSIIEEFHAKEAQRESDGLAVIWWDPQAKGYHVLWCASSQGCNVMKGLAHWENAQFVVPDEYLRDGHAVAYREIYRDITVNAFTQTIDEGPPGGDLHRVLTIKASRIAEAPHNNPTPSR